MKNLSIRLRWLNRKWNRSRYIRSSTQMLLIAILIGVAAGFGAIVFHHTLNLVKTLVFGQFTGFTLPGGIISTGNLPHWLFFLVPTVGGLLSGIIVYTFAPEAEGHGTDAMIDAFHNKDGKVRHRVPFVKAVSSIITIGTGGSAGYEGPTAQIGSGFGSFISELFKLPRKMARLLMLAGTAAGLGAIFRAPLGGALTSVEVIYKEDFESEGFLPSIVASVVAYATFTQVTQTSGALFEVPGNMFTNPVELIFFGLLGVLCAPASWLFVRGFYLTAALFRRMPVPRHIKPAIGGLGVGLIAYVCPQAIGGGWEYLQEAINGSITIWILLLIAGFKIVTTSLTVGSGGSGGVFGPSLFIGGMLGGFFGFGLQSLYPDLVTNPSAYILVGMGAFFAGAANAPLASIVMVCEITGNYSLLAPLMFASVIHLMLSRRWGIYRNQVHNKFESPVHKTQLNTDVLQSIKVSSVLRTQEQVTSVHPGENLKDIRWLLNETEVEVFPVTGKENQLIGLLSLNQLRKVIMETSADNLVIVEDMMTDVYALTMEMDLHSASQVFLTSECNELPVIDDKGLIIGMMKHHDIIHAYDETVKA